MNTADAIKDNDELQSHISKYICVKISGLVEVYFKSQIGDYVDTCSSKPTASFVKHRFKYFTNINCKKIIETLEVFSPDWVDSFKSKMTEGLSSSLDSIVSNRHNIAHGNSDSISYKLLKDHYDNVKKVLGILDSIIKK